ncbi:MAG: amidohydrolase family protein, partial [Flavobacteriales bacterium]|nr:amidohydrolase family protein [Flavobacteriales bacterium]
CHLELSHMKGVAKEHAGLPSFLVDVISKREYNTDHKVERTRSADEEMWQNGIQAVGDICNTDDTAEVKASSRITYHSFVEVFSMDSSRSKKVIEHGIEVAGNFKSRGLSATIVPHAPYSVFEELYRLIRAQQEVFPGSVSIHNQETESENEMFVSGTGALMKTFQDFGVEFPREISNGKSSLQNSLPQMVQDQNLLLVHNTCTSAGDMNHAHAQRGDIYWCTCPNANQYIEKRIPNIPMWLEHNAKVCVGTDSLASNHQLSILEELKLINHHYPEIELETLLNMATLHGSQALQLDKKLGSFDKSKLPGVILIRNVNQNRFTEETTVQRII